MKYCKRNSIKNKKIAHGIIDHIVDKLPEIHIPGYQYCGPGTNLNKRLQRGDPGINELDRSCKAHDIQYSKLKDSKKRRAADKVLFKQSLRRIVSPDAKLSERAAAALVSSLIGTKIGLTKIGLGIKKTNRKMPSTTVVKKKATLKKLSNKVKKSKARAKSKPKSKSKPKPIQFSALVRNARASLKNKLSTAENAAAAAGGADDDGVDNSNVENFNDGVKAAIRSVKQFKRNKAVKVARVLKLPKFGASITPILSILSALSAIGSIPSTATAVARAFKGVKKFVTQKKANAPTEKKIGRGLYLSRKVKGGSGFYLRPIKFH